MLAHGISQFSVEGAVKHGLKEGFEALAGGLRGFQLADFSHPLGKLLLQ